MFVFLLVEIDGDPFGRKSASKEMISVQQPEDIRLYETYKNLLVLWFIIYTQRCMISFLQLDC